MSPLQLTMLEIFGTGLLIATLCALLAGFRRGVAIPLVLLFIGIVSFWGTLFFGSDIGYRRWQSIPNPPPEAFSDASPMGAFLFGWFPAGIYCAFLFLIARVIRILFFKGPREETGVVSSEVITTVLSPHKPSDNPYQSPSQFPPNGSKSE